jgi:hypothetical protein
VLQTPSTIARCIAKSSELAVNNGYDEKDKDSYDRDGDDAVCSHTA